MKIISRHIHKDNARRVMGYLRIAALDYRLPNQYTVRKRWYGWDLVEVEV